MRLREVEVNVNNEKMELDIEGNKPFCVVFCNGRAKVAELPPHGETKIITHQNKVKRVKFDEGEDF